MTESGVGHDFRVLENVLDRGHIAKHASAGIVTRLFCGYSITADYSI